MHVHICVCVIVFLIKFINPNHIVQAIVFYELAFHFNPHCAEACNNLGVIYKDRDNLDKAVECYQAIFAAFGGFEVFICWIFGFVFHAFMIVIIFFMLQMALSIKPNFSQSLNNLGVVYTVQVCFWIISDIRYKNSHMSRELLIIDLLLTGQNGCSCWDDWESYCC